MRYTVRNVTPAMPTPRSVTGPSAPDPSMTPRRDADVVRGHDHAHRRERVAVLAVGDRVAQRLRGRTSPYGTLTSSIAVTRGSYGEV